MSQPLFIQLIADYGTGDPAFAEVTQKLLSLDRQAKVMMVNVPKFSTLATGMWIEQFATVNSFSDLVIFSNTAPRIKKAKNKKDHYGSFCYALLKNKVKVLAVDVGYCFSFIKSQIAVFYEINIPNIGSQFRSRDYYPYAVIDIARNKNKYIGQKLGLHHIPDVPHDRIGFVDGYGNIKTTTRRSQVKIRLGDKIKIKINGISKTGIYVNETFDVADGQISYAPGSTGGSDRYMEIWVKGGSAWEIFGQPAVEEKYTIDIIK